MKSLLIIDGNALLHRAYHALPDFKSKDGKPTNAIYGFASVMHKVVHDMNPTHLLVCFDTKEPTFRDDMYEEYRSHRPETDKELLDQFPIARTFLEAAGIPYYEVDGYEADDVIAVAAREAEKKGIHSVILTGDKDIFQLVNDNISVLTPAIGYSKGKLFDRNGVIEKFNIPPEKIPDFKALGDPSDNYKGVKGIGPKGAVALIEQFGNIENLYNNLNQVENARTRKLLEDEKEHALLSKKLAVLVENIDGLKIDIDDATFSHYNESLRDFFDDYEFRSLQKRYFKDNNKVSEPKKESKKQSKDQLKLF